MVVNDARHPNRKPRRVDDVNDKRKVAASHEKESAAQNGCGPANEKAKK
jgi:hypothetical protein